ncbi:organic hydroperoxide resistance protein [uncultured Corynebacterium sp.]|uniref:organic hydroperoxide resistance protein n=1 Tax=uncultured Corynebacterium sp. TaxID=159447 RepID=UPI0025DA1F0C|nr:organic hydroperoxide resistance protein [uncultured Corynebacterium sp.]
MDVIYTAEALATGAGRNGRAVVPGTDLDLTLAAPKDMGGSGNGYNPEQLFAAGYAACFHSALQMVARAQGVDLGDSSVGAGVSIGKDETSFGLAVELEVVIPGVPHEQAQALADAAHQVCPYSRATRGNIDVTITVAED